MTRRPSGGIISPGAVYSVGQGHGARDYKGRAAGSGEPQASSSLREPRQSSLTQFLGTPGLRSCTADAAPRAT